MATLELAAEKLEVLAKAEAEMRTAREELLKASRKEANAEELTEASRDSTKATEKLTKLREAKETLRSVAQGLVYAGDDYAIAQVIFMEAVIQWECWQRRSQQKMPVAKTRRFNMRRLDGFASRTLTAGPVPCLSSNTPTTHPSTNSELIQTPGDCRQGMLPQQVTPPQADSEFSSMLNASAGGPLLLKHSLTDMGLSHPDLPHRERMAMDAIHQNDKMSSISAVSGFSMPRRSVGADTNVLTNEDRSFRKPSGKPYLHRREGPRPRTYNGRGIDDHAEIFGMAVRGRLEAAEELMKVSKKAAGAKQKLCLNALAKAKENLIKASEAAAYAEKVFRMRCAR